MADISDSGRAGIIIWQVAEGSKRQRIKTANGKEQKQTAKNKSGYGTDRKRSYAIPVFYLASKNFDREILKFKGIFQSNPNLILGAHVQLSSILHLISF